MLFYHDLITMRIQESVDVKQAILENEEMITRIGLIAEAITDTLRRGGKLILCGNGGSASDALHFAGEIVGRFQKERLAWPAVVLNADVATMTAIANDYGYDDVFARQAEGHVNKGDCFVGISTSGNSENVLRALRVAREKGARTVGLTGKSGGLIAREADFGFVVPSQTTARIQESHILIIHILCEIIEENLSVEE